MWFLIKGAFWFTVVLLVLPFFYGEQTPQPQGPAAQVDVADTVSAATEAFGYFSGLCAEKPDVCVKGAETISALGVRAKEGARIAYELLDAQFGSKGDPVMTGTVAERGAAPEPAAVPEEKSPSERIADARMADEGVGALPAARIPVPEWRISPHIRAE